MAELTATQAAFMASVLGADGAEAIVRAVRKSEDLGRLLVPRTLLSWSALVGQYGFEGPIPGVERSWISFSKSESGYSGALTVGNDSIPFTDASIYRLAAHLAVVLEVGDSAPSPRAQGLDLTRLGKSIDLLVRTRAVGEALKKAAPFSMPGAAEGAKRKAIFAGIPGRSPGMPPGASVTAPPGPGTAAGMAPTKPHGATGPAMKPPSPQGGLSGGSSFSMPSTAESQHRAAIMQSAPKTPVPVAPVQAPTKVDKGEESAAKTELPGQQAKPLQQVGAIAPVAPTKQPKQKAPPKPKLPGLKVAKHELGVACNVCGRVQFLGQKFVGCICLSLLAKSVHATPIATGDVVLTFGSGWDMDALEILIEALHGPQS